MLIDWSALTAAPWYTNAVDNLPVAARYVARFLRFLIGSGYPSKLIHLVGFSLGAEVAGFVGKQLQEFGVMLPRITGEYRPTFQIIRTLKALQWLAIICMAWQIFKLKLFNLAL